MTTASRALLRGLFDTAVAAAHPARLLGGRLPPAPPGRVLVVGAGKAAAAMARAVEQSWQGAPDSLSGIVVTRYGHSVPTERITVVEAAHPVPDLAGRAAARQILDAAAALGDGDLLLCLISGGGSSLLAAPASGLTLEDKQLITGALLRSGARIDEINCVRKHLSAIKGGQLAAAAHPARVVTYLISDVPGDDPSVIASGPTVPDASTFSDAMAVVSKYDVEPPPAVAHHLRAGAGLHPSGDAAAPEDRPRETPKPGDPSFAGDEIVMLATALDALTAAARAAQANGLTPIVLGDALQGEARDVAAGHARLAQALACGELAAARTLIAHGLCQSSQALSDLDPVLTLRSPARSSGYVVLSGGETTVTVRGGGRGGRDAEYALALALALDSQPAIWALAADTDGIDGSEDNAGAIVTPSSLQRARGLGLDPAALLAANDSYTFFAELGDLVMTGPTLTNVNDFRALHISQP